MINGCEKRECCWTHIGSPDFVLKQQFRGYLENRTHGLLNLTGRKKTVCGSCGTVRENLTLDGHKALKKLFIVKSNTDIPVCNPNSEEVHINPLTILFALKLNIKTFYVTFPENPAKADLVESKYGLYVLQVFQPVANAQTRMSVLQLQSSAILCPHQALARAIIPPVAPYKPPLTPP